MTVHFSTFNAKQQQQQRRWLCNIFVVNLLQRKMSGAFASGGLSISPISICAQFCSWLGLVCVLGSGTVDLLGWLAAFGDYLRGARQCHAQYSKSYAIWFGIAYSTHIRHIHGWIWINLFYVPYLFLSSFFLALLLYPICLSLCFALLLHSHRSLFALVLFRWI